MLKEYKCFVALWLFPSRSQSLCFYPHLSAPQNANHSGLLRLICLLRISKGQHLQSGIIIILVIRQYTRFLSNSWSFKERRLFVPLAMLIKFVCICFYCQSSVKIICIIICLSVSACLTFDISSKLHKKRTKILLTRVFLIFLLSSPYLDKDIALTRLLSL